MAVACDHSYLIRIVDRKMCVYEDEDIRDRFREWQSWRKEGPGMGICIEDDYEERGRRT